jgi:transposase
MRTISNDEGKMLIEQMQKELQGNSYGKYFYRLHLVLLAVSGMPIKAISELYNVAKSNIYRWVGLTRKYGTVSLFDDERVGRIPRTTEEIKMELKVLLEKSPKEFGYDQGMWDGKMLSDFLNKNYNIALEVRQCQRLMKELGFTMQRPRTMPMGGGEALREPFKKQ